MPARVVLPSINDDDLSAMLRSITRTIQAHDPEAAVWGILGDSDGYGCDFENEVFMMHPYCWCGQDDCPWCGDAQAPNFHHKPSGFKVKWYKYIGRGMEFEGAPADLMAMHAECLASIAAKVSDDV